MKKGYKHTQEYKEQRKKAYVGFSNSGTFKKGNIPWDKGIKRPTFSKEWKEKLRIHNLGNKSHSGEVHDKAYKKRMSESCKGKPKPKGNAHKLWKGGDLKLQCFNRDNFICQICRIGDRDVLQVDHKIPKVLRPELERELNNLWTLCANCHMKKTKRDLVEIKKFRENKLL